MKRYKVKVCIPVPNSVWRGKLEERYIDAKNLNYLLMKAVTVEELKSGARIIEIWEQQDDRYHSYKLIK